MNSAKIHNLHLDSHILFIFIVLYFFIIPYSNFGGLYFFYHFIAITIVLLYYIFDYFITQEQTVFYIKIALISIVIILLPVSSAFRLILERHNTEPYKYVHDNVVQVEAGMKFLTQGKNPYTLDYLQTPLADWEYLENNVRMINPSIYHLIVLPTHLYISLPFYLASNATMGWYDQRFVYLLAYFCTLILIFYLVPQKQNKLIALILIAFNPIFLGDFISGTNDILTLAFLTTSILFLSRNSNKWSCIFLAFAVTTKHSAWFFLPFYFAYYYFQKPEFNLIQKIKYIWSKTYLFFIVACIVVAPFLLWDSQAFISDVYSYPTGGALPLSYPIKGCGIAYLIIAFGFVKNVHDYFPFIILQLPVGATALYFLLKKQKKQNTIGTVLMNYALFLFIFWYLSRFFVYNYIAYIIDIAIIGYFIMEGEKNILATAPKNETTKN